MHSPVAHFMRYFINFNAYFIADYMWNLLIVVQV